jgi:hypothetical protein
MPPCLHTTGYILRIYLYNLIGEETWNPKAVNCCYFFIVIVKCACELVLPIASLDRFSSFRIWRLRWT